jgi:hypothetical protein
MKQRPHRRPRREAGLPAARGEADTLATSEWGRSIFGRHIKFSSTEQMANVTIDNDCLNGGIDS